MTVFKVFSMTRPRIEPRSPGPLWRTLPTWLNNQIMTLYGTAHILCRALPMWLKSVSYRHAGHCWRSKEEFISDILQWTPTYAQAKAGRPARTYIQQLCEDTGCNPEDLPEAMNDREEWRERVRDIRAGGTTWWWWWWWNKRRILKPKRI